MSESTPAIIRRDVTPLSEATVAVTAVRELATVGAAILDTDKRDAAWTALTVLVDLAAVSPNVKARMSREAFAIFAAAATAAEK